MSETFSFHTGRTIGKYHLESLIGRGGMAEVYKSTHPDLGRDLAIKILHPHLTDTEGFIERFRREARAAASLRHPHIVQIYDFSVTDDGLYYMVMEYVEGQPLDSFLRSFHGALPLDLTLKFFTQIASAVQYAHEKGIVHRDLKPGNMLLDQQDQLYLADFGIAQIVGASRLTQSGSTSGTPAYMAPEQVMGKKITHSADIYALGVILYQMVTGHLPYEDENPATMLIKQATEPPPPPRQFEPSVSSAVEAVVLKALEKDANNRYPTVSTMVAALEDAIAQTNNQPLTYTPDTTFAQEVFMSEPEVTLASVPEPQLPTAVSPTPPPPTTTSPTMTQQSPSHQTEQVVTNQTPTWVWAVVAIAVISLILVGFFIGTQRGESNNELVNVTVATTDSVTTESGYPGSGYPAPTEISSVIDLLEEAETPIPTETGIPFPPTNTPMPTSIPPAEIEGMTFVPPGSFLRGSLSGNENEQPVHEVALDGFYMDTTEVTNADYLEFVERHHWPAPTGWIQPDPAIWEVEATEGYLTGNYENRFRYDGSGVQPVTAVFTMSVNADDNIGIVSVVFTGTIQPSETDIYSGTFRVVQTEFFNAPPSPAFREGGLGDHVIMHGASGQETSQYPEVEGYIATWGFADVFLNDSLLFDDYGIHLMYTDGVRDDDEHFIRRADGSCCFSPSAPVDSFADPADPEISVWLFPSSRTPVENNQQFEDTSAGSYTIVEDWTGIYFESVTIIEAPEISKAAIPEGLEDHPVTGVTWDDANAFCQWRGARLPTEAQWEYAARGSNNLIYPWGNEPNSVRVNARDAQAGTVVVDTWPEAASPFGLLHMAGNVWEWTADWYAADASAGAPPVNPVGPPGGDLKVVRGGGFRTLDFTGVDEARTTHRLPLPPTTSTIDVGFRCAMPLGN